MDSFPTQGVDSLSTDQGEWMMNKKGHEKKKG